MKRAFGPSRIGLTVVAVASLVLAACGGDDDTSSSTAAPQPPGETTDTATEADTADDTSAGPGAADDPGADTGDSSAPAPTETIKIAAPLELTGPVAGFAAPYASLLELTIDRINAAGGIKSLGGAQLELLLTDSESDPVRASELLREMAEDGAIAAVGPVGSAVLLGARPTAIETGLPVLTLSLDDALTDGDTGGLMFRMVDRLGGKWVEGAIGLVDAAIASGDIEIDTLGVVAPNSSGGPSVASALEAFAAERGWEVVNHSYDLTQMSDFGPVVADLRDKDVDLVMGVQYPNDSILFTQAIELQDWRPANGFLFIAGQQANPAFRTEVSTSADNMLVAAYMPAGGDCPAHDELKQAFEAETGIPLLNHLGVGPSALQVIVDALERTASTDPAVLRDAIAESTIGYCEGFYMLPGSVDFDDEGDNVAWEPAILQYQPGGTDVLTVWPESIAGATPVWPAFATP